MGEERILGQVRGWTRVQNGVRFGLGGVVVALGATLVARALGWALPREIWDSVPVLVGIGFAWPRRWDRVLLRAGRRLGVGERLAALDVLARGGSPALIVPLREEIAAARPQPGRLVAGRVEVAVVCFSLALGVVVSFLPPTGSIPAALRPREGAVALPDVRAEPSAAQETAPRSSVPRDFASYSPYADLVAAVLGLDDLGALSPEDLARRLVEEEGLLRELVERLRAAALGGLSPAERAELAALAERVSRPDLRERVEALVADGAEAKVREAAEAVDAVAEAAASAAAGNEAGAHASDRAPEEGRTAGGANGEGTAPFGEFGAEGAEALDDTLGGDRLSDAPGTGFGEPLVPGPHGEWGASPGGRAPTLLTGNDGPLRTHLLPGIPGEPAEASATSSVLTPQEVEVVLGARGIPAEFRDLVRRYFELLGGNP